MVKVLEYGLADSDTILDGEMAPSELGKQLVRMPVALISHAYLSRAFRTLDLSHAFRTLDHKRRKQIGIQPSIKAPAIPADDLHLFTFDALRRRSIAKDRQASPWEKERYRDWMERFGDLFFDPKGRLRAAHKRAWFTPATAKILSYYFAGSRSVEAGGSRFV